MHMHTHAYLLLTHTHSPSYPVHLSSAPSSSRHTPYLQHTSTKKRHAVANNKASSSRAYPRPLQRGQFRGNACANYGGSQIPRPHLPFARNLLRRRSEARPNGQGTWVSWMAFPQISAIQCALVCHLQRCMGVVAVLRGGTRMMLKMIGLFCAGVDRQICRL